jgi:flagellar capping protein FliD
MKGWYSNNMQPDHLTYQWLTPIMTGIIASLVGIIGVMIKNYLSSMEKRDQEITDELRTFVTRVEQAMQKMDDRYNQVDKRITRLEDHVVIK